MSHNDAANRIGIKETREEHERNQMVVEDIRLQKEISRDQSPGSSKGKEAKKCNSGSLSTGVACLNHVINAFIGFSRLRKTLKNRELTLKLY